MRAHRLIVLAVLLAAAPLRGQAPTMLGVASADTSPTPPPPAAAGRTACGAFIDRLVEMAEVSPFLAAPLRIARQAQVGTQMIAEARRMTKPDARGRPARELPVDGFKAELIANNQRGEVYRHLYGHGGAMLLGPVGTVISTFAERKDRRQAAGGDDEEGPAEASTELADDATGRLVGRAMRDRIRGRLSTWQLRARLRELLHE